MEISLNYGNETFVNIEIDILFFSLYMNLDSIIPSSG